MRTPTPTRPSLGRRLAVAGAIAVVALVGAGVWYVTRPAPAAVDIDAAVEGVQSGTTDTPADAAPATGSADGTWAVDTTIGTFSVTETTGTFVGFRIAEELTSVGATEAIGRTPDVTGTITIDGDTLTAATFTADLTTIESDEPRREGRIQSALGTDQSPTATFVLTEPVDLGTAPERDQALAVEATGELTVNGVTREVVVPLEAVWTDDVVVVTGSLEVALSDFDVTAPSAPIVVSVADTATVELQLYLSPA